eukprot:Unigene8481_Nuclearia_a/m.25964 Unigene8481_Nuclearia_a/g.25964  ORF Unigene8481_Nuclearia_a/g.25964 Unigene8481_Nuclearia_a/m.25964 type:complete len:289 (+) Unigene8481_Nuclearia_a:41-907(+)
MLRFGLITDLQHADKDAEHVENATRDYRGAVVKLRRAVDGLNAADPPLAFAVHLGDIIDGNTTPAKNDADLAAVLDVAARLRVPRLYHVLGNHCLAGQPRPRLYDALGFDNGPYYSFVAGGWRLVVLDCVDVNVSWPEGTPNHDEAVRWLAEHADARNAKPWNGGVSAAQLAWLRGELAAAEAAGEWVIVLGHIPLTPLSASPHHVLYNADEVRGVLEGCARARWYFAGHYHRGGYALVNGVHHVTGEALLEAPHDSTAYAVVEADASGGRVVVRGTGSFRSHDLVAA